MIILFDTLTESPQSKVLLDDGERKRPRSYLVTDTPDHKQNATILTIKQEKVRKRFSIVNPTTNSPVVPETPIKDESSLLPPSNNSAAVEQPAAAQKIISMSSRYRDLIFSGHRSYSLSPKKNFPRK